MIKTRDIAKDILNDKIDINDLPNNIELLNEVDSSLVNMIREESIWQEFAIAKKRKLIIAKIQYLLDKGVYGDGSKED